MEEFLDTKKVNVKQYENVVEQLTTHLKKELSPEEIKLLKSALQPGQDKAQQLQQIKKFPENTHTEILALMDFLSNDLNQIKVTAEKHNINVLPLNGNHGPDNVPKITTAVIGAVKKGFSME